MNNGQQIWRPITADTIYAGKLTASRIYAGCISDPDGSLRRMTDDLIRDLSQKIPAGTINSYVIPDRSINPPHFGDRRYSECPELWADRNLMQSRPEA